MAILTTEELFKKSNPLNNIKTTDEIMGITMPIPTEANITQKQNILLKFEDNFSLLDSTIDEDYKKWQEYSKQLDDIEMQLEEAPKELQFKLANDYNKIRELHNNLVDKLQATTKQQQQVKKEYDLVRDSYEKDISNYNKVVEAKNKEIQQSTPIIEGLPMSKPEDKPISEIESVTGFDPEVGAKETKELTSTVQSHTKAKKEVWGQWFKELKESEDKLAFLQGEGYSEELKNLSIQDIKQSQIASEQGVNLDDWVRTGVYATFFATLASEIIPIVKDATPEIIKNIFYKAGVENIDKRELQTALYNISKGTDTLKQRKIFDEFIKAKDAGVPFLERLKGVKLTTIQPRFAFAGKLYAGLPADEIAKSIIEVGKVTAEVVKGLDPAKAIQTYQALLNTSPALASEFLKAVEKPEGIPEPPKKEVELPTIKPEEKVIPEPQVAPEKVKEEIPKAGVKEPTFDKTDTDMPFYNSLLKNPEYAEKNKGLKVSVKMMSPEQYLEDVSKMQGITSAEQVSFIDDKLIDKYVDIMKQGVKMPMLVIDEASKLQEGRHRAIVAQKLGIKEIPVLIVEKAQPKPPTTITPEPTQQSTKVPATLAEAKEILKVDPKKPSQPKELLAKQMVAKKVSLADIEAVKGEKVDVSKPKDILIALKDIKAVKKEAVAEPTPKVAPKEPEPITEQKAEVEAVTEKATTKELAPEELKIKIKDVYNIGENITQAKVKPLVRKTTGQAMGDVTRFRSKGEKIEIYESNILKLVLEGEVKGAKLAFKEGKAEGVFDTKEHYEDVVARAKIRKYQKDYIIKLTSDIAKLPTQNMAVDYKEMIEGIKAEFDLKKRTAKTIARRAKLADYIEKQAELDHEVDIPQNEIDLIRKKPLNDMTIEELETVHDNIMHLAHLGKTKNKLLQIREKRNINNQIDTLVDTITKGEGITVKDVIKTGKEDKTFFQGIKEAGQTYHYNTIRAERLFEQADNYKDSGEFWTTFFKPINEATYQEQDNYNAKLDEFRGFIKDNDINIGKFLADKQEINDRVTLTSTEKVEVFLATFDKDKMRHLIRGNNFQEKDITDVVNSLTPQEKAMGEYLVKHYDEQYKGINDIYKKLTGKNMPKIPGYSPIRLLSETIDTSRDIIESLLTKYNVRPSIRKGFTKERTKGAVQPLNLDAVNNLMFNLSRVEHYKAFVLPIRDINKLLSNPKLIEAIKQKRGNPFYQNLKSWLLDVSDTNPGISFDQVDKIARLLRVRAADAMLGFNVVSAMKQPISVLNACAEIGVFNVLNGIQQLTKSPIATSRIVYKKSPLVRNRKGQFDRVISELEQSKNIKQIIKQSKTKSDVIIGLLKFMDQQSVKAVWKGAYDQALGKNMTDQQAIDYADKVIRKTQPMAGVKDLAKWFRGGTLSKMFTMFQNQVNNNYNYYTQDILGKYRAGEIGVGKVMYRVAFSYIMPALLMGMITRGRLPKDTKEVLKDLVSFPIAGLFFVGAIVRSIVDGFDEFSIPPLSWANDIIKAGTMKTIPTKIKYGLSALAKVLGIPWNQPYRSVKGMIDYLGGATDDLRRLVYSEYALAEEKTTTTSKYNTGKSYNTSTSYQTGKKYNTGK